MLKARVRKSAEKKIVGIYDGRNENYGNGAKAGTKRRKGAFDGGADRGAEESDTGDSTRLGDTAHPESGINGDADVLDSLNLGGEYPFVKT